jgi:uncharacterized protein YprB with RNaseH-like and TPR domain
MTPDFGRHLDRFYSERPASPTVGRRSLNFKQFGGKERATAAGPTLELTRHYAWSDLPAQASFQRIVEEGWLPVHIDPRQGARVAADGAAFVDIETTGLSIGAGTVAFLIGTLSLDSDGLVLKQFLLRDFAEECAQQLALAEALAPFDLVVTYNGGRFDLPVLRSRAVLNRVEAPWLAHAHLDLLHPVRAIWRNTWPDCRLATAEHRLLGVVRDVDCEGWEVPLRYRQFLLEQSEAPLIEVLEHNAQDLISLAGITAVVQHLLDPDRGEFGLTQAELFGLARALLTRDREGQALRVLEQGRALGRLAPDYMRAMRMLCRLLKRRGEWPAAREVWHEIGTSQDPWDRYWAHLEEAKAAEHKLRDPESARQSAQSALQALDELPRAAAIQRLRGKLHHRLDRLEKRLKDR